MTKRSAVAGEPGLQRRLGVFDAVVIGLGSMIGAGIFAALAPAARAAGSGLLLGLALAAVVAYCNATSSARLAAQYPASGSADALSKSIPNTDEPPTNEPRPQTRDVAAQPWPTAPRESGGAPVHTCHHDRRPSGSPSIVVERTSALAARNGLLELLPLH
jgi:hypothetical protein